MTGSVLIIVGILFFIAGIFVVYNSGVQVNVPNVVSNQSVPTILPIKTVIPAKELIHVKDVGNELSQITAMAIADGLLTANERNLIKEFTHNNGLSYVAVVRDVESKIANHNNPKEAELINQQKKNGVDFEKFIVQQFNSEHFRVKEWAGDKYVNGIYAETTLQPDLLMELNLNKKYYPFSVECKWRQSFSNGGIEFAYMDQFKRYKAFEIKRNIPVFIAIGIGGKATSPDHIYIVPLRMIDSNFISLKTLQIFKKDNDNHFYYDIKTKILK